MILSPSHHDTISLYKFDKDCKGAKISEMRKQKC